MADDVVVELDAWLGAWEGPDDYRVTVQRARNEIVALRKRGARVMTDDTIELVAQELIDKVGIPDMPLALAIAKVAIAAISRAEP